MRLDEVDQVRALLDRQISQNHLDAVEGREWPFEERPGLEADQRAWEREAAAHRVEQAVLAEGRLPHGYTVTVESTLTFDIDPAAQRNLVSCPECGADRCFRLWARGDAEHSAWLACEAGHEWTHPNVTYDWVRLVADQAAALQSADEPPAIVLDYAHLKRAAESRYVLEPPEAG